jgi:hypothetical protein
LISDFHHVSKAVLRTTLNMHPREVTMQKLRTAFRLTAEALGRDVIDDTVPQEALDYRLEMARQAHDAIASGQRAKALAALQLFWII